jgi:hypothetical protein
MIHSLYARITTIKLSPPETLTAEQEQIIHQRKWMAVILMIIGGILLAGRVPIPMSVSYVFLLFGHLGMLHQMYLKQDAPLLVVNMIWVMIDVLGMYRWWLS